MLQINLEFDEFTSRGSIETCKLGFLALSNIGYHEKIHQSTKSPCTYHQGLNTHTKPLQSNMNKIEKQLLYSV